MNVIGFALFLLFVVGAVQPRALIARIDDQVLTFTASLVYRLSATSSVSSIATDATTDTDSIPGDIRRLSID